MWYEWMCGKANPYTGFVQTCEWARVEDILSHKANVFSLRSHFSVWYDMQQGNRRIT